MTPQEIFEYKLSWRDRAYRVDIDEWSEYRGKAWCRKNIEQQSWAFTKWTTQYDHGFLFEHEKDYISFREYMK